MIMYNRRTTVLNLLIGSLALLLVGHTAVVQELRAQAKSNHLTQLNETASAVAKGVGTVGTAWNEGSKGTVFVFEEFHTSRVGQLQIAAMLLRLHDRYGIRRIGLEGAIQSARPLDATWYRNVGGDLAKVAREDVAIRMLGEGEISSAEFMTMLFPDIAVIGTEIAALYNTELTARGNPEIDYLLAIAEKGLSQQDIRKVNGLINGKQQKEALEYMLSVDPWVRQQYAAIKGSSTSGAVPLEQMRRRLLDIQAKAAAVSAGVE